jgi:hypothetical protein
LYPVSIAWEIGEVLEQTAAREKAQLSAYSLLQRLHIKEADGKARRQSAIGGVLADIDMMIDGAYVKALADGAGAWTRSSNQRVIDMRETRRASQIVLY